jgi:hypothetical protein
MAAVARKRAKADEASSQRAVAMDAAKRRCREMFASRDSRHGDSSDVHANRDASGMYQAYDEASALAGSALAGSALAGSALAGSTLAGREAQVSDLCGDGAAASAIYAHETASALGARDADSMFGSAHVRAEQSSTQGMQERPRNSAGDLSELRHKDASNFGAEAHAHAVKTAYTDASSEYAARTRNNARGGNHGMPGGVSMGFLNAGQVFASRAASAAADADALGGYARRGQSVFGTRDDDTYSQSEFAPMKSRRVPLTANQPIPQIMDSDIEGPSAVVQATWQKDEQGIRRTHDSNNTPGMEATGQVLVEGNAQGRHNQDKIKSPSVSIENQNPGKMPREASQQLQAAAQQPEDSAMSKLDMSDMDLSKLGASHIGSSQLHMSKMGVDMSKMGVDMSNLDGSKLEFSKLDDLMMTTGLGSDLDLDSNLGGAVKSRGNATKTSAMGVSKDKYIRTKHLAEKQVHACVFVFVFVCVFVWFLCTRICTRVYHIYIYMRIYVHEYYM